MANLQKKKDRLTAVFSEWIRRRDANQWGNIVCPICRRVDLPWKQMQCLHYHKRRFEAIAWDESNAIGGCALCNQAEERDKDMRDKFTVVMLRKFGPENMVRIRNLKYTSPKFTASELDDMIKKYKQKIREL